MTDTLRSAIFAGKSCDFKVVSANRQLFVIAIAWVTKVETCVTSDFGTSGGCISIGKRMGIVSTINKDGWSTKGAVTTEVLYEQMLDSNWVYNIRHLILIDKKTPGIVSIFKLSG